MALADLRVTPRETRFAPSTNRLLPNYSSSNPVCPTVANMVKPLRILLFLILASAALGAEPPSPFQEDMYREFDAYRERLLQLARAIPEDKYDWRPAADVRSIKEVILHVGLNNYMLLDMMGRPVPKDIYGTLPTAQPDRQRAIFQKNLQLEKQISGRQKVAEVTERAFTLAAEPLRDTSPIGLNAPAMFINRKTTAGGLQLRMIAHLHEHLGQLIAYARSVGVTPPWSQ